MQPDTTDNIGHIARTFVEARRNGDAVPEFPGDVPATLGEGYKVQDAALLLVEGVVAGWKVGRINPPIDGVDRLTGPIFASQIVDGEDEPVAMPVFAQGFAAAEAEFLLRIGSAPDPSKTQYTMAEARAMVDAVHVGIEIASSPFPGINALGATVTVSDFGNNNGLVIGPDADGWRDGDINAWPVELWINDVRIGAATSATMLDGPFGAVRYLLEHMAARGIALSSGQWVSTGAVTGVHPVAVGDRVEARFDERFAVHCTIKAR
ncbi:2-keto-4-pentenoate hydratase [Sphingomonas sp. R86520]|uniref:2-keto-4-pentenoate hydratase n=1 Tax=Sphingomonas sp. R86520 TaxID=3093859 RepID=UPI0036D237D5